MSHSGSQYESDGVSSNSSLEPHSRANSRRPSHIPGLSRKRRRQSRSDSVDQLAVRKYHLEGHYNDDYRALFNEDITFAAARFSDDVAFQPPKAQIGASEWTAREKSVFFVALGKLGKHDIRGIAEALATKTVPEVQEFLTLLTTASASQRNAKVTLHDIPAAIELGDECVQRLDLAGDTLSWYQERFEAKQEQERFGDYWLITPEIAQRIEDTIHSPGRLFDSSPPLEGGEERDAADPVESETSLQLSQDIPEAELIDTSMLLELSSSLFMNTAPMLQASFPHWATLVSPLASKPSIYRTALIDFHALVVSLTKRLTQASIIQATSRLRSQSWRSKNGVKPILKRRDVLTAIDTLRLRRNGKEWWRGLARRCKLSVVQGTEKRTRILDWDEVEALMDVDERPSESMSMSMDAETPGFTSGNESIDFKRRAVRNGTPLPFANMSEHDDDDDTGDTNDADDADGFNRHYETGSSDEDITDFDEAPDSQAQATQSSRGASQHPLEHEISTVEDFDAEATRQEELRLWAILGGLPNPNPLVASKFEHESRHAEAQKSVSRLDPDVNVWQDLTDFRAEWEEFQVPVPPQSFTADRKGTPALHPMPSIEANGVENSDSPDMENGRSRRKRRKASEADIPMLGAGAYAAKASEAGQALYEDGIIDADMADDFVAKSVEGGAQNFWSEAQFHDVME